MSEKRFIVFASRFTEMTAVVYAENEEEARKIAEDSASVEWEFENYEDTIDEVREEAKQ